MTTTLPADPETERLAEEVAKAKGKPVASVVREAIAATAEAAGVLPPPRRPIDMDKIHAILARADALPVRDPRSADEIIGYDEFGLPR
jgi:antitoxin VapB